MTEYIFTKLNFTVIYYMLLIHCSLICFGRTSATVILRMPARVTCLSRDIMAVGAVYEQFTDVCHIRFRCG